jgi:hypothetical protein
MTKRMASGVELEIEFGFGFEELLATEPALLLALDSGFVHALPRK